MKLFSLDLVRNSAGGSSWQVDDWTRLQRFLILGSEGGSYYAGERELTIQNAKTVLRCLQLDPARTLRTIVDISVSGRAPRNDAAILSLALACGVQGAGNAALAALPEVCRTGTHLFMFMHYVKQSRGFGRSLRRGLARWYEEQSPERLAYQLLKYRRRARWTHRDVLRLCHPCAASPAHQALFRFVVGAESGYRVVRRHESKVCYPPVLDLPALVSAFVELQNSTTDHQACRILLANGSLTWEMVPTELLGSARVWHTLLPQLPMMAMVRNLGRMQANGTLRDKGAIALVRERLVQSEAITAARLHPLFLLSAMHAYKSGSSRGGQCWQPEASILCALESAFYLSFGNLRPAGKRTMLALDVSGSMAAPIANLNLSCREASAAMAMITARSEPGFTTMAFTSKFVPLTLRREHRLSEVLAMTDRLSFGGTDCAQPMLWALKNKVAVDTFVVYTDCETWAGKVDPYTALQKYRDKMGIPARLVVVGMVSNGFSIADPNDPGMLDVVGFDTAAPDLISDFSSGGFTLSPQPRPPLLQAKNG